MRIFLVVFFICSMLSTAYAVGTPDITSCSTDDDCSYLYCSWTGVSPVTGYNWKAMVNNIPGETGWVTMDQGATPSTTFYTADVYYDPNWSTYYQGQVQAYLTTVSYVWNPILKIYIPIYLTAYSYWDSYPVSIVNCN